jgi:hypothetical protein
MTDNRIQHLNTALLGCVAIGAFVLSAAKLVPFAVAAGTPPKLAWILPLVIDGSICIAILGHWQALKAGQDATPFRLLNVSCAAMSVLFNVWQALNSSPGSVSQSVAVAALAPILLWGASEIILKSALHRSEGASGSGGSDLHLHDHLHFEGPASDCLGAAMDHRRRQVAVMVQQGWNTSAIARELNVSRGTIYSDKLAIQEAVDAPS